MSKECIHFFGPLCISQNSSFPAVNNNKIKNWKKKGKRLQVLLRIVPTSRGPFKDKSRTSISEKSLGYIWYIAYM